MIKKRDLGAIIPKQLVVSMEAIGISKECVVCYERIIGQAEIRCQNPTCFAFICPDCLWEYLNIFVTENKIPVCPNRTCRTKYVLKDLPKTSEWRELYTKCVLAELTATSGSEARGIIEQNQRLQQVRNKRLVTISSKFPIAISYLAQTVMVKKLRALEEGVVNKIKNESGVHRRFCMNLVCPGRLDQNFQCFACATRFCQDCEEKMEDNHRCKQEEIDSVNEKRNYIQCPQCHMSIVRSEGCDNMTCAHCGKMFNYVTGKEGGSGSHNSAIVKQKQKRLLSEVYGPQIKREDAMSLLLRIEGKAPPVSDFDVVTKALAAYIEAPSDLTANTVVAKHNKYYINTIKNKLYQQIMNDLEAKMVKGTLSMPDLVGAINAVNAKL